MNDAPYTRRWLLTGLCLLVVLLATACASPAAGPGASAPQAESAPPTATVAPAEAQAAPTAEVPASEAAPAVESEIAVPTAEVSASEAAPAAESETAAPTAEAASAAQEDSFLTIRIGADGANVLLALNLNADGTFELVTDAHTAAPTVVESGVWTDNGDGTITATLNRHDSTAYFAPFSVTLRRDGERLTVIASDQALASAIGLQFTQAAEMARRVVTGLITIDLAAGFPLDPTFVSVNGGGEVDASILGEGCSGFINTSPVVTVNWTGEAELVKAFFVSDSDSTLVVLTPDGQVLCNDDAGENLLDPLIELTNPAVGQYRIWIGSYAKSQLIPGILVLSTRSDVGLGSFALANFIKRPLISEIAAKPVRKAMTETLASGAVSLRAKLPALAAGQEPLRRSMAANGTAPAFEVDFGDALCNGFLSATPDYVFDWSGQADSLRFWFEGDGDATLLVVGPDQQPLCNDDALAGENVNPLIEIADPLEGQYSVYVGRVQLDNPVTGDLVITDSATVQPAEQTPAAPAQP